MDVRKLYQVYVVLGIEALLVGSCLAYPNLMAVTLLVLNSSSSFTPLEVLRFEWGGVMLWIGLISVLVGGLGIWRGKQDKKMAIGLSMAGLILLGVCSLGLFKSIDPQVTPLDKFLIMVAAIAFIALTGNAAWETPSLSRLEGAGGILAFLGAIIVAAVFSSISLCDVSSFLVLCVGVGLGIGLNMTGLMILKEQQ